MKQGPNKAPDGDALFPKPINQPGSVAEKTPLPADLGDSGIEPGSQHNEATLVPALIPFPRDLRSGGDAPPRFLPPRRASVSRAMSPLKTPHPGRTPVFRSSDPNTFNRVKSSSIATSSRGSSARGAWGLSGWSGTWSSIPIAALKLIVSGIAFDPQCGRGSSAKRGSWPGSAPPNVVRVYDARMAKDAAFIEMEYHPGPEPQQAAQAGRRDAARLDGRSLDQLCDVLQAAQATRGSSIATSSPPT